MPYRQPARQKYKNIFLQIKKIVYLLLFQNVTKNNNQKQSMFLIVNLIF